MRKFNVTGTCYPEEHYMADISRQVEDACKLVRDNNYFCINRGRQYGKTTTLLQVKRKLEQEGYCVLSLSFEGLDDISYSSTAKMAATFVWLLNDYIESHAEIKICEEVKSNYF